MFLFWMENPNKTIEDLVSINDIVVLVTEPSSHLFGQIGKIKDFDYDASSAMLQFQDGSITYICGGSKTLGGKFKYFYRHLNQRGHNFDESESRAEAGPMNFLMEYVSIGGKVNVLREAYNMLFGEEF